jgi:hypothetical protein
MEATLAPLPNSGKIGLDDWIYCTLYIHTVRDYRHYSAIAILHTLQFTVTHALGFSFFTSRILATNLSQSRCHLNSHMKSSLQRLIPFLPFLLNHLRLPSPERDPILFRLLFCTPSRLLTVPFYNPLARTTQKTPSSIVKDVFTGPLPRNGCPLPRALVSRECVYRPVA